MMTRFVSPTEKSQRPLLVLAFALSAFSVTTSIVGQLLWYNLSILIITNRCRNRCPGENRLARSWRVRDGEKKVSARCVTTNCVPQGEGDSFQMGVAMCKCLGGERRGEKSVGEMSQGIVLRSEKASRLHYSKLLSQCLGEKKIVGFWREREKCRRDVSQGIVRFRQPPIGGGVPPCPTWRHHRTATAQQTKIVAK